MPEGPEVLLSADLIRPILQNRQVIDIFTYPTSRYLREEPEGFYDFQNSLQNQVIINNISVKGKFMHWEFSNNWYLFSTFGMSGQWSSIKGKHPCFSLKHQNLNDSSDIQDIYFNDPRHFGTIKFTNNRQDWLDKINQLGWDPLSENLSEYKKWLDSIFSKTDKTIGQVLLDQSIFAGSGNYIRAEVLYDSKISPFRKCSSLTQTEKDLLYQSLSKVMKDSYLHQGATIQTYKTAYGEEGKYSSQFKVYGQNTDPLGNPIIKEKSPEGRTIHWCPNIQK